MQYYHFTFHWEISMKLKIKGALHTSMSVAAALILSGCAAMMTLPTEKLSEAASAVTGKSIKSVSNVRSVGDKQFFDAQSVDGKTYACSLSVVMGMAYQHQKCELK